MRLKTGVRLASLTTQMVIGVLIAERVFYEKGFSFTITSSNDSAHSLTSLHNSGNAIDIRTRHLTIQQAREVRDEIVARAGKDFDVLLEGVERRQDGSEYTTDKYHIHIEYQPRGSGG